VTDILGRIRNYVYDTSGRLTDVKDANQNILTHYNYYTSGACQLMKDITDARQITYLTNQYIVGATRTSANPCLVSLQTLADQTTFSFSYFNNYRLYYDITTAGGTCVNHVCPMFDPSILDPPSVTITQAGVSNPQGVQRKVTFDPDTGYAVKDSRALGLPEEQTTTYNDGVASSGVLNYFTDQLNRRTTISYDTAGKGDIVSITRLTGTSSQKTWTFSYEPKYHQLQTMAEPGLPASTLGYDTSGNLKSVTDPSGVKWTLQLNTHGQVASVTDPLGLYTTSFRYEAGDLVGIKDPNGNETVRFVDAGGRLRAVRDALSRITRYDYDEINRRTTITDPLGNATQFGYDGNGNLTSVQDARLNTTVYDYDSMDRLMDRKDPLYPSDNSHIDRYTYDFAGNLASHTDRKGQVTVLSYDNLNRAKCVKFAATVGANACAAPDIQYTVDAGNRLTGIADSNPTAGNIALTPDNLDFYTTVSSPQGIISYTPDPATGRRSQMSVSGQSTTTYGFDSADRLSQVTRGANAVSIIPESPIPTGRIGTVNLPGGYSVVYGYDPNGRVSSVQYKNGTSVLGGLTYTYDAVGNRTGVGGSWSGTLVPSSVSFGSYDAANRLSSLTYDKNNNVTYDGTNTYGWDVRDQLAGVTGPTNETFQYDSFGRRLQRTVAGVPNNYTYDGLNPINVTANGTSTDLLGGLRLDQYFATVASSVTKAILPDALGSTIALADTSSPPTQPQFTYEPFGRSSNPAGPPVIQFTGRENDGDGLYYYRARYYQPTSGRFISEDPIGITARAPNLYAYVGNSPIGHRDPTGLCPMIAPMSGGLFNFLPDILPEGAGEGWTIGEPTDPTWQGNSFFSPDGFEFHWTQYARSHASDFPNGYWHVMDWNTGDLTRVGPNDTGGFGGSNNGGLVPPFGGRKAGSAPSRPPGWPCT
jgi:RHS repeat-associated protein